jgi:hypothetical protein
MRIRDFTRFGFNEALFPGQELPPEEQAQHRRAGEA